MNQQGGKGKFIAVYQQSVIQPPSTYNILVDSQSADGGCKVSSYRVSYFQPKVGVWETQLFIAGVWGDVTHIFRRL